MSETETAVDTSVEALVEAEREYALALRLEQHARVQHAEAEERWAVASSGCNAARRRLLEIQQARVEAS